MPIAELVPTTGTKPLINSTSVTAAIKDNQALAYAKKFAPIPLPAQFLPMPPPPRKFARHAEFILKLLPDLPVTTAMLK